MTLTRGPAGFGALRPILGLARPSQGSVRLVRGLFDFLFTVEGGQARAGPEGLEVKAKCLTRKLCVRRCLLRLISLRVGVYHHIETRPTKVAGARPPVPQRLLAPGPYVQDLQMPLLCLVLRHLRVRYASRSPCPQPHSCVRGGQRGVVLH